MVYIWLTIVVLLTIVELMTIHLTTVWFVASALVALVLTFFVDSFTIQFTVFILLGIILLITTRPTLLKMLAKHRSKKSITHLIGMRGQVIEPIDKEQLGEVKVDGIIWIAEADEEISFGTYVTVIELNDNKLKVRHES
ncbi:MAG: NfeD family protein [Bacilli bacterium]|nr:NfeD family protein [Bacilli bacterium]MDD4283094.1 NfeD family protein [Bacilli bacterium]MDD4719162.1 NfeD family protein [Bacilli bacterium]